MKGDTTKGVFFREPFFMSERARGSYVFRKEEGMKITVNGEIMECQENMVLENWLEKQGYVKERIAVELNGTILPKAQYSAYMLAPDDLLEVVTFVGGG